MPGTTPAQPSEQSSGNVPTYSLTKRHEDDIASFSAALDALLTSSGGSARMDLFWDGMTGETEKDKPVRWIND